MPPFASFPTSASIDSISIGFPRSLSTGGIPQCLSTSTPASPLPARTASSLWSPSSLRPFPPSNPSLYHHLWPRRSHSHRDPTPIRTQPTATTATIHSNWNPFNQNKPNQTIQTIILFQTIQTIVLFQAIQTIILFQTIQKDSTSLPL